MCYVHFDIQKSYLLCFHVDVYVSSVGFLLWVSLDFFGLYIWSLLNSIVMTDCNFVLFFDEITIKYEQKLEKIANLIAKMSRTVQIEICLDFS